MNIQTNRGPQDDPVGPTADPSAPLGVETGPETLRDSAEFRGPIEPLEGATFYFTLSSAS